jgi:glutathione S-transferase
LIHTDFFRHQGSGNETHRQLHQSLRAKISVLLLEKGIEFEFVNEQPYNAENGVAQYNPLGKSRRW